MLRPAHVLLQAEKLDGLLEKRGITIDRVLNFVVPDSVLVSAPVIVSTSQDPWHIPAAHACRILP